jgi:hypothetical protein
MMMNSAAIVQQACELLASGDKVGAAAHLCNTYPGAPSSVRRGTWSAFRVLRLFVRDGFTDRYSGQPLIFPGALRALSILLPAAFPYQRNWKQSETHPAFWELSPTLDHVIPVARGGADDESNVVTTSMLRNAAKSNWLLQELNWPTELAPISENWDGLVPWFVSSYEHSEVLQGHPAMRAWYRVAKRGQA